MAIGEIHVADTVAFNITIKDENNNPKNISAAIVKNIIFEDPNGNILTYPLNFITDGTDGQVTYTTLPTDLSIDGNWYYQIFIRITSINQSFSDYTKFKVLPNLPI